MNKLQLFALALVLTLTTGCFSSGMLGKTDGGPSLTGSLELNGATFGQASLQPTLCTSGEREVFLGADFANPASPLVARLVVDPLGGPGVRIFDREKRYEKAIVLRREDCATFHFSLDQTGWRINDIYQLKVHLELDCQLASGDSVKGSLDASSCV